MDKYILKLAPYVSETIWGGRKLIDEFGVVTEKSNAAEGWMLSCLDMGPSVIVNGEYAGRSLPDVIGVSPEWCGAAVRRFSEFPVLIKFIDAMDNLSVQVHPTKEYCEKKGSGASKTECWYILDCEEGAELLLGFKEEISAEAFEKAVRDGTLTDYVGRVKVHPGDFFFIEAGTLHAICRGVLLAEVQESSNTTYRIFDYNRLDKNGNARELHVADALAVTKREPYSQPDFGREDDPALLADCDLFKVHKYDINGEFKGFAGDRSFVSLLVLNGGGMLVCGSESLELKKGDSIFIPASSGEFTVSGALQILETEI